MVTRCELINLFEKKAKPKGWVMNGADFPSKDIDDDVFPNQDNIFNMLSLISPKDVKYLILGQDPYYTFREDVQERNVPHAIGIAFAVESDCKDIPPSLNNIMKKIYDEGEGRNDLKDWIQTKGLLLLNAALTVPRPKPGTDGRKVAGSHVPIWRNFTASIISQLKPLLPANHFIAWGCDARDILDEAFRQFTWSNHPSVPGFGNDKSFNKFWETEIGTDLRMKHSN